MKNGKAQDPTPQSETDIFCPACGYNLRGIDSPRCPECGEALDYVKAAGPQLPWLRRDELGTVRAYWQTVWTAIRHKKRFWSELGRPVSYADSQRFRWITVLIVYLPLIPITIALFLIDSKEFFSIDSRPFLGTALRDQPTLTIGTTRGSARVS